MQKRIFVTTALLLSLLICIYNFSQKKGGLAGKETCLTCHEESVKGFNSTPHGSVAEGCEACHGAGKAHVDGGGDKTKIINPATAPSAEVNEKCLSCHDQMEGRRFFAGSTHALEGLSCSSCHSIHKPKKLEKGFLRNGSTTAICLSCHKNMEKTLFTRSRHPLREGKMECTSCHNPHGTPQAKMLKATNANELCFTCHTEMRGPFLFSHSPVTENCMNCHDPHGTSQENMLIRRENRLCQSCHLEGKHQTVSGRPNDTWDSYRMCTNCHANIHGSNHPSGYKFLR